MIAGRKTEKNEKRAGQEKAREHERARWKKTGGKIEQEQGKTRRNQDGRVATGISSSQVCPPPPMQGRARLGAGCCPVWGLELWIQLDPTGH
jgi:hypothetical protein